MQELAHPNVLLVREYLCALQNGEAGESLARFFTQDVLQIELPNRLNPGGHVSTLEQIIARSIQGRGLLVSQRYEIVDEVAQGESVATAARWVGVLGIPLGSLPAGAELKAHFAMFFTFSEGRIRRQRNYDCFESW